MSTQVVSQEAVRRRSARAWAITALGPATMFAAVIWAFVQPWRVTLLHPHGQGFWWLLRRAAAPRRARRAWSFAVFIAPGVIEDLEAHEDDR